MNLKGRNLKISLEFRVWLHDETLENALVKAFPSMQPVQQVEKDVKA